jgi:DNA mismatch repair ATPase MutS
MVIDRETRRDLELFRTRDGKPGVFQTLDLTKTPGGRRALRVRFETPMVEPELIRAVQDGVRFLHKERVGFDLDANLIQAVEQYLGSNWDVASRARGTRFFLDALTVHLGYRDLFRHARDGVAVTLRFFSQVIPFLKAIAEKDPPPEVMRPVENLLDLMDRLRLDELRLSRRPWVIYRVDRYLRVERKADFQRFFALLYDLDALIAMAEGMEEKGLVIPDVVEGQELFVEGEGVFHLFVEEPVGNSVALTPGRNLVFLTGPNMAGKTTYLKAVAVATYLGHVGMAVPAESFRFAPLEGIYTSLSPEENLREGLSFFMAEVRRVREIAAAVAEGRRALVIFDEVFRGTNVKDALDASLLVIRGFARSRSCGFFFSSHLVELAEELREEQSVGFSNFEGRIRDQKAWYEFDLKEGVSDQRFGLQLLEEEGVPEILRSLEEG